LLTTEEQLAGIRADKKKKETGVPSDYLMAGKMAWSEHAKG